MGVVRISDFLIWLVFGVESQSNTFHFKNRIIFGTIFTVFISEHLKELLKRVIIYVLLSFRGTHLLTNI